MSASPKEKPRKKKKGKSRWSLEHRQQAYLEARNQGLVVAPPLNPPLLHPSVR